jgi:gephyrin
VLDLGIVGDTMEETTRALKKGKEEADVIISTGGTSMGVEDLLKPCIEREMKGTVHFGRVIMKPGYASSLSPVGVILTKILLA